MLIGFLIVWAGLRLGISWVVVCDQSVEETVCLQQKCGCIGI